MAKAKISKSVVDGLEAREARYIVWDAELKGFGVRVSTAGRKTYIFTYRIGGRSGTSQLVTLGVHGRITADHARRLAKITSGEVAGGKDVAKRRRDAKKAAGAERTVEAVSREFLEMHVEKKKASTRRHYASLLNNHINPAIGRHKIKDLTFGDVGKLQHAMRATPSQANRAMAVLSKMMTWAIRAGYRPDRQNPCKGVERYREQRRQRFLSEAELAALGQAIVQAETVGVPWKLNEDAPYPKHRAKDAETRVQKLSPYAAAALQMLIFTGARLNEIMTLRWEYVDMEAGELRLPDSKTGAKTIYLNAPARRVLASLERIKDNPHVFPGEKEGAHRTDLKYPWDIVRDMAGLKGVRIHDLRHTLASHGQAAGLPLAMVGGLLGHKNVATTHGYAHLWSDPLKEAADKVGKRLANALQGNFGEKRGDVVQFRRVRRLPR